MKALIPILIGLLVVGCGGGRNHFSVGALSKISFEEFTFIKRPVLRAKFPGASKVEIMPVTNTLGEHVLPN